MRLAMALMVAVAHFGTASAGDVYFAYYADLEAYPTGAGKVYASQEEVADPSEITSWADQTEMKIVGTSAQYYAYAQPADGWIHVGFSTADFDADKEPVFNDYVTHTGNPAVISLQSAITDDPEGQNSDSLTVLAKMPIQYNNVHYALFTHVAAQYAPGQNELGTISVTPLCNDIGDEVTLSAEAATDGTHPNARFDRWTLNGQTVSTDPELTITVTDTAHYVAHFTADDATIIDFGNGSYRFFYPGEDADVTIPENVSLVQFLPDSFVIARPSDFQSAMGVYTSSYNVSAGTPALLYGVGEATIIASPYGATPVNPSLLNRWSGSGVSTADLDLLHHYYTFDDATLTLNKVEGNIEPNTVYVALPDTTWSGKTDPTTGRRLSEAPEVIYLSNAQPVATSIGRPHTTATQPRGIYTLDGRRVSTMSDEGVYIIDGRKIIYRKP